MAKEHKIYYELTISGEDRIVLEHLLPEVWDRELEAEEIQVRCECGTNLNEEQCKDQGA